MADTLDTTLPEAARKALFRFAYTVGDEDDWQDPEVDDLEAEEPKAPPEKPTRH